MKLRLILKSQAWALALASAGSSFGSDLVSPDGNRMAYVVPIYDKQVSANHDQEVPANCVVFERATDGTSTNMLGKVPVDRPIVSWIGNDRVAVHEFAHADRLYLWDIAGRRQEELVLPPEYHAYYLEVSPDGERVTFTGYRSAVDKPQMGLFVYGVKDGQVRCLLEKNVKTLAAWSPDSKKLAVGVGGYNRNYPLQIVDVATGEVDDTGLEGVGYSWSPDGKLIACTTESQHGGTRFMGVPTDGKLGIYDVQERKMRTVAGTEGALQPAWSRSGKTVAFVAHAGMGGHMQLGFATREGVKLPVTHPIHESYALGWPQLGWCRDETVYVLSATGLARLPSR